MRARENPADTGPVHTTINT